MRAVGAPVSGVVNENAQGREGMRNTFSFERSADNLNYVVDNREQCEMFSKLMNNNALPQEECKGIKDKLKVWKEEALVSRKKILVDSLSNFGNFFMNAIDVMTNTLRDYLIVLYIIIMQYTRLSLMF